ncbi:insulin-like peptide 6 isoform 2-T3 [Cochliomyia hominivorax]
MFSPKYIISTRRRILSLTTIILVIYLIVIIYMPSPAQTHPLSPQDRHVPQRRYCSQALFEAIQIICDGRTRSLSSKFPDSFGNRKKSLLRRLLPSEDVIYTPSFSGAAHECCRRPCGYSELHEYCED